jgi:hypothetical protein
VTQRQRSAAFDLGLTPEARADYHDRLNFMFREACIMFGAAEAARLFRAQAKRAPKRGGGGKSRKLPPVKRKGGHDPEADYLLLLSWQTFNGSNKLRWAEMALTHHAVKNNGRVRSQKIAPRSLVRRLNRILKRKSDLRQIGRQKTKA